MKGEEREFWAGYLVPLLCLLQWPGTFSCHNGTKPIILRIKEETEKLSPGSTETMSLPSIFVLSNQSGPGFEQISFPSVLYLWTLNFQALKDSIAGRKRVPGLVTKSLRLNCQLSADMDIILNSISLDSLKMGRLSSSFHRALALTLTAASVPTFTSSQA